MLLLATLLAFAAATASAWLVFRKRRQYLPIAALLTLGIVGDLCGELLRRGYLDNIRAKPLPLWLYIEGLPRKLPTAYTGLARAAYHVEQALFLAWPAGVVCCSLFLLNGVHAHRSSRSRNENWVTGFRDCVTKTGGAWFAAVLVHVSGYPTLRQDTLALALRIEQGIAVAALAWCVVAWSANDRAREPEHAAAVVLAIAEATVLLFVHTGIVFDTWAVAQAIYLNAFLLMLCGQMRWLCKTR